MKEKVEEAIKILDSAITLRLKNSFFELEKEEQLAAVKKAYRGLSFIFHPDKGGSAEEFRKIVEAKNFLLSIININKLTLCCITQDIIYNVKIDLLEVPNGRIVAEIPKFVNKNGYTIIEKETSNILSEELDLSFQQSVGLLFRSHYRFDLYDSIIDLQTHGILEEPDMCEFEVVDSRIFINIVCRVTQNDVHDGMIDTGFGVYKTIDHDIEFGDSLVVDLNDFLSIRFLFFPIIVV